MRLDSAVGLPLAFGLLLGVAIFALWWGFADAASIQRPYRDVAPQDFSAARHTHVCTTGTVTLKRQEADGDIHLRITAGGKGIVAEEIPALPVAAVRLVKTGQRVRACGIRRYDDAPGHMHWEIHPLERLEVLS